MSATFDRTVLITGASSGIGAATARRLAARGARLALLSRRVDDLGLPDVLSLSCDVRDLDAVEAAVAATVERFGGIDTVIPNAGLATYGRLETVSPERVTEMIDVNLHGTINVVRAAYPHLKASPAADIVGVVSVAGLRAFPDNTGYAASKFGQLGFLRSLDHEARADGIRVTSICPGGVATDFAVGDGRGRTPDMPEFADMLSADDVAYAIEAALLAPRNGRVLELVMRHMNEASWG